jgi:drug/metabolite transporter (DMT)-like permease
MTQPHQERSGLLYAALCALNGAFVPAFAKLTIGENDPFFIAAATNIFGAICAALVLGIRGELGILVRPRVGPRLAAIGALGTAAAYYLFFLGASVSSAIDTVLCLQIEPAYALVLAWVFLGHRPTLRRIAATFALLAGIAIAIGAEGFTGSSGTWILLATPICWQVSHLITLRGLRGVTPSVLTGARYIYGGAMLAIVYAVAGDHALLPNAGELWRLLPLLVFQGVILYYAGTLLWYNAVTRLDLARTTAIVVPSVPVLSLGASFILLGETASVRQLLGLLLTATGVFAFVTAPHPVDAVERVPTASAPIDLPADGEGSA